MNTKSIFQRAVFTSITIALILTFTIGKVNNTNVLDLFDGVLNAEASSGNISPSFLCSTGAYQQNPSVYTASDLTFITALDTPVLFDTSTFTNALNPSLAVDESLSSLCIQSTPNFGQLYKGNFAINPNPIISPYGFNSSYDIYNNFTKYVPPTGFKGLACFSYYTRYASPTIYANNGNRPADTNVSQIKIQVGGSTSTTCGADPVVTPATISGKIYNDQNQSGLQENFESDYSVTSPYPAGTTVTITEITTPSNTFIIIPNPNGTYSQTLIPGQYSVKVNTPVNYALSVSQDLGTTGNTGSDPTLVTIAANETKSVGKDGIYLKHQVTGSIFPDLNSNGIQDTNENYSINNPHPAGTTVQISCLYPALTTFNYTPIIDVNGFYFQQVNDFNISGTICTTTITPPSGYLVSNSTDLGDGGIGSNPTAIPMPAGAFSKSQGKDGLYQIPTTGTITGTVYLDINDNGIRESYEQSAYGNYGQVLIRKLNSNNNLNYVDLLPDGSYSSTLPAGTYEVILFDNIYGEHLSVSTDNGDGVGNNPTVLTIAAGENKSAGIDGINYYNPSLCTNGGGYASFDLFGSIKASAEELPTNCVTIAGSIYVDKNNNGTQNPNEPSYSITNPFPAGTTAILTLVNDITTFFEMLINPDGTYSQTVPWGQYEVKINTPTGFTISNSTENGAGTGSNPTVVNTTRGLTTQAGKDGLFNGVLPLTTGTITGKIYPDLNNNGFQDTDEPDYSTSNPSPVNTVRITNTTTSAFFDTAVNIDGTYSQVVPAGDFSITVTAPALYTISNSIELGNGQDSNPTILTVVAGDTKSAGKDGISQIFSSGAISGKVYNDTNQNGYQDLNEPDYNTTDNIMPLGTSVTFTNPDDPSISFSMPPNADGTYVIELPTTGFTPYIVNVTTNQNYIVTQSNEIGLSSNIGTNPTRILSVRPDTNYDAGKDGLYLLPTTGTITGKVYKDDNINGIQDIFELDFDTSNIIAANNTTITLTEISNPINTFTIVPNPDGTYSQVVAPGQYTVTVNTGSKYSISNSSELGDGTASNPTTLTIAAGETKSAGKDGLYVTPSSVTGKIYNDLNNNGLQDNNEPDYSTTNPFPAGTKIKIEFGHNDIDCIESCTYVSGEIIIDPNVDGSYSYNILTSSYRTTILPPPNYTISYSTELGDGTGANPTTLTIAFGENKSAGKDGLYQILTTGTVTGKIYSDFNNNGFQDTNEPDYSAPNNIPNYFLRITNTITLEYFDTIVNIDGTYSQVVPAGDYSVTVTAPALYTISNSTENGDGTGSNPTILTVAAGESKNAGKDGLHKKNSKIIGNLYYDNNRNGIQDLNDPTDFIQQARVTLTNITDPLYTGTPILVNGNFISEGEYVFEVDPGVYSLLVTDANGYDITPSLENGDGIGSNPTIVTIGENETKSAGKDGFNGYNASTCTYNLLAFGFFDIFGSVRAFAADSECATITGSIYQDINNNANQDSSEPNFSTSSPIISGTTVNIVSQTNSALSFVTLINPDGSYTQQVPPGTYNITVNAPLSYLISLPNQVIGANSKTTTIQIVAGETKFAGNEGLFNGVLPPIVTPQQTIGGTILTQTNQLQTSSTVASKSSESTPSKKLQEISNVVSTLAINREFDLNDPYECGSYVYGEIISNPSIIADLKLEFSQEGKIVKTYNLKSNTDGTWKQLLDDLAYGKYSYKVVANYQELTDTESFEIQHKSLEECQNNVTSTNILANRVSKDSMDIVLARTGGLSVRFNSPFVTLTLILVLAFVVSIFRNLNYLKALYLYSFFFVSYLYSK
jgi:large repetitive protein